MTLQVLRAQLLRFPEPTSSGASPVLSERESSTEDVERIATPSLLFVQRSAVVFTPFSDRVERKTLMKLGGRGEKRRFVKGRSAGVAVMLVAILTLFAFTAIVSLLLLSRSLACYLSKARALLSSPSVIVIDVLLPKAG